MRQDIIEYLQSEIKRRCEWFLLYFEDCYGQVDA